MQKDHTTQFGALTFVSPARMKEHIAPVTMDALVTHNLNEEVLGATIDATVSDTAAFCSTYDIPMDVAANCVIVEAKRASSTWYAACIILATDRIDINGAVRKHLEARKISFAPMDTATSLTEMEYGGITPIGLPKDWPILIDSAVTKKEKVIVGSGVRGSKLLVPGALLAKLPHATVLATAKEGQ